MGGKFVALGWIIYCRYNAVFIPLEYTYGLKE